MSLLLIVGGDSNPETSRTAQAVEASLADTEHEGQRQRAELVVIMPLKDWSCVSCGTSGALLIMDDAGPLCMACADMDHLVFLPAGDAALTRRAKRASRLSAVVVRFSRAAPAL